MTGPSKLHTLLYIQCFINHLGLLMRLQMSKIRILSNGSRRLWASAGTAFIRPFQWSAINKLDDTKPPAPLREKVMVSDHSAHAIKTASDVTAQNFRETIPRGKASGLERTALLKDVDPILWAPIVGDLIDWTCDPNWPSAHVILPMLVESPITIEAAIPHVSKILQACGPCNADSNARDGGHQDVLLYNFVYKIPQRYQVRLLPLLKEFRENIPEEVERDFEWCWDLDHFIQDTEEFETKENGAS